MPNLVVLSVSNNGLILNTLGFLLIRNTEPSVLICKLGSAGELDGLRETLHMGKLEI